MELDGKVAIVTGGASGLGEATVDAYVAKGMKVAIFDMNAERAATVIERHGADKVVFHSVNVSDEESVKAAVAAVVETFGALHVCNNYAGIGNANKTYGKRGVFPMDEYMKVVMVNQVGTFNVSRFAAEAMAACDPVTDDGGRGSLSTPRRLPPTRGKSASWPTPPPGCRGRHDPADGPGLGAYGIRVNTIVPGLIHHTLFDLLPEPAYKFLESSVLYPQRLGKPAEIAHLSVFIAENDYLNGQCVRLGRCAYGCEPR